MANGADDDPLLAFNRVDFVTELLDAGADFSHLFFGRMQLYGNNHKPFSLLPIP
jgi:hypothetical protein